jgi:hypothetical protein
MLQELRARLGEKLMGPAEFARARPANRRVKIIPLILLEIFSIAAWHDRRIGLIRRALAT